MSASVKGRPVVQCIVLGWGDWPTLMSVGMFASALLAAAWHSTVVKGSFDTVVGVARKDSCTALRTHSFLSVSQGTPQAISACGWRKSRSITWPNGYQPVACNAPPTLSAISSSVRASPPENERRRPLGRQLARTVSCSRHTCLREHRHVCCPRYICVHTAWRRQPHGKCAFIPNKEGARELSMASHRAG